ncbi:hypothetical protein MKZ07_20930 [Paenibacillus sp. FSL P4-0338]|uniref:hypothetical protein n=1 Tax=unclassified Paenibacillus TaxID=185978 RepID=UPI0003E26EF9|nr:hypothetical protein [Paenibacillus sp. FSL R7-269]ETT56529.1 hypothetical protein C162_01104 [Paenibacillus sp. FSL R7-269]
MRKISIISISMIILLVFIYVLVRPNPEIVSVSLISETAEITYTDNDSIRIFSDAIRTVKKVRGAVDVGPPTYRMNVTYADSEVVKFSLYLDYKIKSGFLINDSNSEKMLKLKESSSKELTDLLSKD